MRTPQSDFDALLARLAERLEGRVALTITVTALVALALLTFARFSGVRVGLTAIYVSVGFASFYLLEYGAYRAGLYRPWMRYLATLFDVTMPTLIVYTNVLEHGAVFALMGGGPPLYLLATCATTLRLNPRICVMVGLVGALQYAAITFWVVLPAGTAAEAQALASQGYLTIIKSAFIATSGVFAAFVTSSMGGLMRRLVWSAVDHDRLRGELGREADQQTVDRLAVQAQQGGQGVLTSLSVQIRGFSRLAEEREPQEVMQILSAFFEQLSAVVTRFGGLVARTDGSGMICIFTHSHRPGDEAARALEAAHHLLAEAGRLTVAGKVVKLKIGVGLHCGPALVGSISPQARQFTFVGQAITLARGLQELTRRIGPGIVFSEAFRQALGAFAQPKNLGWFEVSTQDELVEVFAPSEAAPTGAAPLEARAS